MAIVLVVDDDEAVREVLRLVLEDAGHTPLTSVDGESLWLAVAAQPAAILLDINMPGMDGIEVCRRLRADARTRHIPIVATSAGGTLAAHAREMDVDAVLPKPFDINDIVTLVERLVRDGRPNA